MSSRANFSVLWVRADMTLYLPGSSSMRLSVEAIPTLRARSFAARDRPRRAISPVLASSTVRVAESRLLTTSACIPSSRPRPSSSPLPSTTQPPPPRPARALYTSTTTLLSQREIGATSLRTDSGIRGGQVEIVRRGRVGSSRAGSERLGSPVYRSHCLFAFVRSPTPNF